MYISSTFNFNAIISLHSSSSSHDTQLLIPYTFRRRSPSFLIREHLIIIERIRFILNSTTAEVSAAATAA